MRVLTLSLYRGVLENLIHRHFPTFGPGPDPVMTSEDEDYEEFSAASADDVALLSSEEEEEEFAVVKEEDSDEGTTSVCPALGLCRYF